MENLGYRFTVYWSVVFLNQKLWGFFWIPNTIYNIFLIFRIQFNNLLKSDKW